MMIETVVFILTVVSFVNAIIVFWLYKTVDELIKDVTVLKLIVKMDGEEE